MSEDRLEQALEAMREEPVDAAELAGARARVWEKLEASAAPACVEFRPALSDYLEGRLPPSRQLLVDDHLGRCTRCRALLAELRGEPKVVRLAPRRAAHWPRWGTWAAAAVLVAAAIYAGRDRIDTMLAPAGPRATVASVSGSVYRVPGGTLQTGAAIGERETVRTGPGGRAVLRLADGSLVELNERTEVLVRSAWSGRTVQLERGDIIVAAATQRRGHLRVQTRDSVASVKGTIFAVSAGLRGTLVSVVEGAVAVAQPGVETVLQSGRQSASNPGLVHSVQDAVSWSVDADRYIALLASFARLEKTIAELPSPPLRTESRLLRQLPENMFVYGAIPNLGGTLDQASALADLEAVENPVFREWWNSEAGREIRRLVDHIRTMAPMLGDEVVFAFGKTAAGAEIPIVVAEVQAGKRAGLASALQAVRFDADQAPFPYSLTDTLMVASDSQEHLRWMKDHLGRGAESPFTAALAERYRRGAGWLVGLDVEAALAEAPNDKEAELLRAQGLKHLFFEQRTVQGVDENEVTVTFEGPRAGMASWLASSGSGGAGEYLPADAILSAYISMREPQQLFDELVAQLGRVDPSVTEELAEAEAKLGFRLSTDLAAALGTETALALEGFSVSGPVWMMAVLVNDPAKLDDCIVRLVDVFNSELGPEDQTKRLTIVRETVDGRDWIRLESGASSLGATWTYDRGYLVAASDRGAALRAISARSGGSALVWSAGFRQQLPSSGGLHPSAFVWLDTKGALQGLESFLKDPTIQKLVAEKDPILVVLGGSTEQIRAASRTRWTGLVIDVMMLQTLGRSAGGPMVPKKDPQRRASRAGTP